MDCLVAACSGGQQAAAAFSCPRMPCWDTDVVEVRGQAVQGEISHHHVSATDLFCAELKCRTPVFAWIAAFLIFQGEEHSDQLRSLAQLKQAALFFRGLMLLLPLSRRALVVCICTQRFNVTPRD